MEADIQNNMTAILQQIRQTERQCKRDFNSVKLLAVSKTQSCDAIMQAYTAGQRAFGENYLQEALEKIQFFAQNSPATKIEWHFIGPIQSNKTAAIAQHFDWVHSVDRLKIAQRLSQQRPQNAQPLQLLIQVNTSGEASKSGVAIDQVLPLAQQIVTLKNIQLRGLMSIPAATVDSEQQQLAFQQLADLQQQIKTHYPQLDTLSMGMSQDKAAAIAAGSTLVRIGTAIFGSRNN